jgi:hypothetical protein
MSKQQDTTEFRRETTLQNLGGAEPRVTMMSPEGAKLAEKTAPTSAFKNTTISTSAVDKSMRGGR